MRPLTASDISNYRELRLRAFRESSGSFSESHEDEHDLPDSHFAAVMGLDAEHFTLGAFEGEQLIGVATFKRDRRSKARHKSSIHTMYVAPEFRGKQVGQRLLADLISRARAMAGLEQLHLWVLNPESSPARRVYARSGFQAQGPVVRNDLKIDGKYVDAEYMTLVL